MEIPEAPLKEFPNFRPSLGDPTRRLGDHEIPVRAACLYGDPITREEVLGAPSSHQMRMRRWGKGYDAEASRRGDSGLRSSATTWREALSPRQTATAARGLLNGHQREFCGPAID
jgi:hypothetical protein